MNVRVEAGSLNAGLTASIVEPTVKVEIKVLQTINFTSARTCFTLATPSVNGHSLSGVNPELTLMGGMATLAAA